MFKKILLVEDIDSIGLGLKAMLQQIIPDADIRVTKFCDEALLKVKRSVAEDAPFDIIITDLSFPENHTVNGIQTGEELISCIRTVLPHVKIMVYSICDNAHRVYNLFYTTCINALVQKSNSSLAEFSTVLELLYATEATYITPAILPYIEKRPNNEISHFDILILQYLAKGYTQKELIDKVKEIYPNTCLSTVEKHISHLKSIMNAHNTIQLVAVSKDLGII